MKRFVIILLFCLCPITLFAVGQAGYDLQFSGSTSGNMVLVPNNALLNFNTSYTIEAWVKWEGGTIVSGQTPRIVDRRGYFAFYFGPGSATYGEFRVWFTVYPSPDGSPSVSIASTIKTSNLNDWHHVAVAVQPYSTTYRAQIYIDGVQAATADNAAFGLLSPARTNENLRIGKSWADTNPWLGQIDDVRIWTVRRSATDIKNFRGVPLSGSEAGLLAYWNLNEGSGSTAADATSNHLDGTVSSTNANWLVSTAPIGYNLLNPNSGVFTWGTPINIDWSVNPEIATVDLHQSPDNGATWQLIAAGLNNPKNRIGTYSTIIPLINTTQVLYRVSKAGDPSQFDTNDQLITWTDAGFVPIELEFEAEIATLTKHMYIGIDGKAFGCQFIYSSRNAGGGEGTGSINIDIPTAGTYFLWARLLGQGETRNSFFVKIDNGTEYVLEVPAYNRWIWVQLPVARGSADPAPFVLTAGPHTLHIRGRENYARIDRVVLTNDPRPNYACPEPNEYIKLVRPDADYEKVAIVRNTKYEIQWEEQNIGNNVTIEVSLDYGQTFTVVDPDAKNTRSFMWQVPDTVADYVLLRLSKPGTQCPMDQSWTPFSITNPPPEIHVLAPNGGEVLVAKDTTRIEWSNYYFNGNVSLYYSYDHGENWTPIAENIPNLGFFYWVVPKTISEACLVKVKNAVADIPWDVSDAVFSIIRPPSEMPAIWVLAPNGGEQFEVGQTETISWNSEYLNTPVTLYFSADSGATWSVIATELPPVGSYQWLIPNSPSEKCLVKAADAQSGIPFDKSDAVFTINAIPINYALLFDGVDDFVQVTNHPSLNVSKSMTIEFWMQTDRLAQEWCRILEKGTFDEYAVSLYGNTGRMSGAMRIAIPGATQWATVFGPSQSILSQRVWTHVALTYDGAEAKLFINGELETTTAVKAAPRKLLGDLIIGGSLHNNIYEYHYRGLIDELRIWNVPRSAAEIAEHMFKRVKADAAGLVAYYTFDEGSGQTLVDHSLNGNHGRLGKTDQEDSSDPIWYPCERPVAPAALVALQRSQPTMEELAELEPVPDEFSLAQNYPNPFNTSTTIVFMAPASAAGQHVTLQVFDLQGRLIQTLFTGACEPGKHSVVWDGRDQYGQMAASGLYFYRLQSGNFVTVKRLVMLK